MEERTDLDILLKRPVPQDVVAAIFAYSGLRTFTNNPEKIHGFIRENKSGKAAELLEPFVFSEGVDIYPYSRLLESVLTGLHLGRLIFTWGPGFKGYYMEDQAIRKIKRDTEKRFSSEQMVVLKQLGAKWQELNISFLVMP